MGQNMDDAHVFYKGAWAMEMMTNVFAGEKPVFERLINPQSDDEKQRAVRLREKYKMDPARMKQLDDQYGPLDWRLPEAHAIYWASVGLDHAKSEDLLPLRRVIYQSMNMAFQRGRLLLGPNSPPRFLPNLEIIPKTDKAFRDQMAADPEKRDSIQKAYRNFLREVPYQLYINNRVREGEQWLRYVREQFPEGIPSNMTLAQFAVDRATENARDSSQNKMAGLVQAFVAQSFFALVEGRAEDANEYMARANELRAAYNDRVRNNERLALPTIDATKKVILRDLLDPQRGLPAEAQARLRTALPQLSEEVAPLKK
jgi:hypothetical protein